LIFIIILIWVGRTTVDKETLQRPYGPRSPINLENCTQNNQVYLLSTLHHHEELCPPLSTWAHHKGLNNFPSSLRHAPVCPPFLWAHECTLKPSRHVPFPLEYVSVPSLSPWVHEHTSKAWRPKDPSCVSAPLLVSLPLFECMGTLQIPKWPLPSFMIWKCTLLVSIPILLCMQVILCCRW